MTDQEFSCGFKSQPIGEYAIGLSKSNQSLHGFSTRTAFCSEFAQIKTWEKPPIKAKYLVTLRDQSVYSHGMQFSLCPLTEYNLYPTKLISKVTETPERILYTKTQSFAR